MEAFVALLIALIVIPLIVGTVRARAGIRADEAEYQRFLADMDALKPRKGNK